MNYINPKVPVKKLKNGDFFLAYHTDRNVHVWQIEDDTIIKEGNVKCVKSVKDITNPKKASVSLAMSDWPVQPILLIDGHVKVIQEN